MTNIKVLRAGVMMMTIVGVMGASSNFGVGYAWPGHKSRKNDTSPPDRTQAALDLVLASLAASDFDREEPSQKQLMIDVQTILTAAADAHAAGEQTLSWGIPVHIQKSALMSDSFTTQTGYGGTPSKSFRHGIRSVTLERINTGLMVPEIRFWLELTNSTTKVLTVRPFSSHKRSVSSPFSMIELKDQHNPTEAVRLITPKLKPKAKVPKLPKVLR